MRIREQVLEFVSEIAMKIRGRLTYTEEVTRMGLQSKAAKLAIDRITGPEIS